MANELGKVGVWLPVWSTTPATAAAVEKLGYTTLWIGGSPAADLKPIEEILDATENLVVGTSIVNMWASDAAEVAASFHRIEAKHPGRFVLGVGIGHPEHTEGYQSPYDKIVEYLGQLEAAGVPKASLGLAALGPKVVKLAGERTAMALPYLTTPEHATRSKKDLGGALLVAEQKVVLETDPEAARAIARPMVGMYLGLANYVTNLKRLGFSSEELADGGADSVIDKLALHGDAATIAAGLRAHLEAGADQIAVQPIAEDPLPTLEALAKELL